MDFIKFPVGGTNLYPAANTVHGGQLQTEFNIRSRETVATHSAVDYIIGPSYTHSLRDYKVTKLLDSVNDPISTSIIQIAPGRALVNGHYVEIFEPIAVDLSEANMLLRKSARAVLKGRLCIGLRAMYSTYETLAGSILTENDEEFYEGIHVVILPEKDFITPIDSPTDFNKVTAHLKLATFNYVNGAISGDIKDNEDRIKVLGADKIGRIDDILSDIYVRKTGLDPNRLYVFAGKSPDGKNIDGRDTWCDSTDSLMIWDKTPRLSYAEATDVEKAIQEATFRYNPQLDRMEFVLPHKQVDGMEATPGTPARYPHKFIPIPNADWGSRSGGILNKSMINTLRALDSKINTCYRLPNGRFRGYKQTLNHVNELPNIPRGLSRFSAKVAADQNVQRILAAVNTLQGKVGRLSNAVSDFKTTLKSELSEEIYARVNEGLINPIDARLQKLEERMRLLQDEVATVQTTIGSDLAGITMPEYSNPTGDPTEHDGGQNANIQALYGLVAALGDAQEKFAALEEYLKFVKDNTLNVLDLSAYVHLLDYDIKQIDRNFDTRAKNVVNSIVEDLTDEIKGELVDDIAQQLETLKNVLEASINDLKNTYKISDEWAPGDYFLVGQDATQTVQFEGRYPSTMYVVCPGPVLSVAYVGRVDENSVGSDSAPTYLNTFDKDSDTYTDAIAQFKRWVPNSLVHGAEILRVETEDASLKSRLNSGDLTVFHELINDDISNYNGTPGRDYFVIELIETDGNLETRTAYFYTPSMTTVDMHWSTPFWLTGGIPLATETAIGGFLNVPSEALDQGYVYLDESGHLRLLDYSLLRTGVLAYQLGQNFSEGSGLDIPSLQTIFDEYINERVAFPNDYQKAYIAENNADPNGVWKDPHTIDIYLTFPEDAEGELFIHSIDSRFGTAVCLHIEGKATDKCIINIANCEKLRIDPVIGGNPVINLYRTCLYYDATVLNALHEVEELSLWYKKYEDTDPDLQVDGMTVIHLGKSDMTQSSDYWSATAPNDNKYSWGLKQLTFGQDGMVIGCGVVITDIVTSNIEEIGKYIFCDRFVLPQGSELSYPEKRVRKPLKIDGTWTTAYAPEGEETDYHVKTTNFSALTQSYVEKNSWNQDPTVIDPHDLANYDWTDGHIALFTEVDVVYSINGIQAGTAIDAMEGGQLHIFYGGVVD